MTWFHFKTYRRWMRQYCRQSKWKYHFSTCLCSWTAGLIKYLLAFNLQRFYSTYSNECSCCQLVNFRTGFQVQLTLMGMSLVFLKIFYLDKMSGDHQSYYSTGSTKSIEYIFQGPWMFCASPTNRFERISLDKWNLLPAGVSPEYNVIKLYWSFETKTVQFVCFFD